MSATLAQPCAGGPDMAVKRTPPEGRVMSRVFCGSTAGHRAVVAAVSLALVLSACNTVDGVGRDIEALGRGVQNLTSRITSGTGSANRADEAQESGS